MGQLKKVIVIILAVILSITVLATTLYAAYSTGTYRITAKSGLNVRAGAGTGYSIVTAVPYNSTVTVTQVSGSWGKITYNGRTGWISLAYAQKVNQAPSYKSVNYNVAITTKAGLNMRSGAGTSYSWVSSIPYNKTVTITREQSGWGFTTYNGKSGWILLSYTQRVSQTSGSTTNPANSSSSKTVRYTANVSTKIGNTTIVAGDTFYTWNKSGNYKSTSGNYNTYRYVKIDNKLVDVGSAQCMAYVRYCQQLVYGVNDFLNANNFQYTSYRNNLSQSVNEIRGIITRAGAGAHLRVNSNKHSMLVIQVDNDGFYYTDANATSKANIICLGYITWSDFKKQWNNVYYTEKYKG